MKIIAGAILAIIMTFAAQAEELPESLKGTPESYITVSLCINLAALYYHEDKEIELAKAVGRAAYDCKEEIDKYLSLLLEVPAISEGRLKSNMSVDDAIEALKYNQIFQMQADVLRTIEANK
jgi:hypothetical protein